MVSTGLTALVVHGGVDNPANDFVRRGLMSAWREGFTKSNPVDAVVEAVATLEDDVHFNAGVGSVLNSRGEVETDAAVVDSEAGRYAGVAALSGFRNPVRVADALMERSGPALLVGEGAARFAADAGLEKGDLITSEQIAALASAGNGVSPFTGLRIGDTVGGIAVGADGTIAVASSTGGVMGKLPGRVGDAPIFGAGIFATRTVGVLSSGLGEHSLRVALAARVGLECDGGTPVIRAVRAAIDAASRLGVISALLVVHTKQKVVVAAHTGSAFPLMVGSAFVDVAASTTFEMGLPTPDQERMSE